MLYGRRLRHTANLRDLTAEVSLDRAHLMQPHFVCAGKDITRPIPSMPGIAQMSPDRLRRRVEDDLELGLNKILLFGVVDQDLKDPEGSAALRDDSPVVQALHHLRPLAPDLTVACDVCLCAYTTHGHCCVHGPQLQHNDATVLQLAQMSLKLAEAGCGMVAPSAMMDGQVAVIRQALNEAGRADLPLMAYSVKYASAYYGPFREAADCAPKESSRQGYQLDYRGRREAIRLARADAVAGADIVMVKPALAYLDIVAVVRASVNVPVAAYNVSGEYGLVKAAAASGWADEGKLVRENLFAMRRAGADLLITYHARDAVKERWL